MKSVTVRSLSKCSTTALIGFAVVLQVCHVGEVWGKPPIAPRTGQSGAEDKPGLFGRLFRAGQKPKLRIEINIRVDGLRAEVGERLRQFVNLEQLSDLARKTGDRHPLPLPELDLFKDSEQNQLFYHFVTFDVNTNDYREWFDVKRQPPGMLAGPLQMQQMVQGRAKIMESILHTLNLELQGGSAAGGLITPIVTVNRMRGTSEPGIYLIREEFKDLLYIDNGRIRVNPGSEVLFIERLALEMEFLGPNRAVAEVLQGIFTRWDKMTPAKRAFVLTNLILRNSRTPGSTTHSRHDFILAVLTGTPLSEVKELDPFKNASVPDDITILAAAALSHLTGEELRDRLIRADPNLAGQADPCVYLTTGAD